MDKGKYTNANCSFCGYKCGLTATVQDGKLQAVEPDPARFPYYESIYRGCQRWKAAVEFIDHPQRINYPLKRKGERGSGQWQRISWVQALDEISEKLQLLKNKYGPEMLATSIGGPNATFWPLHRFMNLFGSPNNMGIGQICWNSGIWVNTLTYGWTIDNELDPNRTECAMIWGSNPAESDNSLFWSTIKEYSANGKPLIVVDPRCTRTAKKATLWLPLRPGTDAFLVLGLLRVIIAENLYDHQFVKTWCHGFDLLCESTTKYTPHYVESITGIKAEDIVKAARLFAQKTPSALFSGRGIDQLGVNTVPTHRALAILRAITGNVDVQGSSHLSENPDFIPELDLELSEKITEDMYEKQLGKDKVLLHSYSGYDRIKQLTMKHGKRLPKRYLTSAHPNLVWKAMLTGKPYPVRSLIVMATNPMLTQADTSLIYEALKSLDLLVVLELFQTPTSMLADYVLPSAGAMESPEFETKAGTSNLAYGGEQAVNPYYERKPDYYFWRELGLRLGQEKDWPWKTFHESLEECLKPTGITWEEFCSTGLYCPPNLYQKYEQVDENTGKLAGFATTSGKIELYSEILDELGYEPLPVPKELSKKNNMYPLKLITGARYQPYYAASYHHFAKLRSIHPKPLAEMCPDTAIKLGLEDSCPVWVETERGRARFNLKIVQMCKEVVSLEYGWWNPELEAKEPCLGGVWDSNANMLTSGDFETSDPLIGTWTYNGLRCRVERA